MIIKKTWIIIEEFDDETGTRRTIKHNDGFSLIELLGITELTRNELIDTVRAENKREVIEK